MVRGRKQGWQGREWEGGAGESVTLELSLDT